MSQAQLNIDLQLRDKLTLMVLYLLRYLNHVQIHSILPIVAKLLPSFDITTTPEWGPEGTRSRVAKLVKAGFVNLVGWPKRRSFESNLYTVNHGRYSNGAKFLYDELGVPKQEVIAELSRVRKYLSKRSYGQYSKLRHNEGLNDYRVSLACGIHQHHTAAWAQGAPNWMREKSQQVITVTAPNDLIPDKVLKKLSNIGEYETDITRKPDDSSILMPEKNKDHRILYLYEHDEYTEDLAWILAKIFCFWQWHKTGAYKEEADNLRVLFKTKNDTHMTNMIKEVYRLIPGGSRLFWFTTDIDIGGRWTKENILQPVWTVAHKTHQDEKHSILEKTI